MNNSTAPYEIDINGVKMELGRNHPFLITYMENIITKLILL